MAQLKDLIVNGASRFLGKITAGIVQATSFIKSGGTSSQFLKADGSVDSTSYQSTLVSGTNIKTINNESLLGSGNITIQGGGGGGEIYDVIYQTTTGAQIKAAYDAGKSLRLLVESNGITLILPMTLYTYDSTTNTVSAVFSGMADFFGTKGWYLVTFEDVDGTADWTPSPVNFSPDDLDSYYNSTATITSTKVIYDAVHPVIDTSGSTTIMPNTAHDFGTVTSNTTFVIVAPSSSQVYSDRANWYYITFSTGSVAPSITWSISGGFLSWLGGSAPTINTGKIYEVIIINSLAVCLEY